MLWSIQIYYFYLFCHLFCAQIEKEMCGYRVTQYKTQGLIFNYCIASPLLFQLIDYAKNVYALDIIGTVYGWL